MSDSTPAVAEDAALPAVPDDLDTGLEDFDAEDFVMPRIAIDHPKAVFVDKLTGEEFPEMTVVLLGLIKQRILWDTDVDEGDQPLCKSYDFREGHPFVNKFPWGPSGFEKPADGTFPNLPCEACQLKEWGSNPTGDTPWCSEQHTFPLMQILGDEGDGYAPALLTVQRSAIKPSKAYLTAFARSKTPLYTVKTKVSLTAQKRGSVNYAVPSFVRQEPTPADDYGFFAQQYRQIREFIGTPPKPRDDAPAASSAAPAPAAAPAAPAAPAAAATDDDDIPF